MNYIDILILVSVALFAYMGYLRGFVRDALDLAALVLSIYLAVATYTSVGTSLSSMTSLPTSLANTVAFFLVWFAGMFVYYAAITFGFEYIPERWRVSKTNQYLGIIPGLLRGLLFVWFSANLLLILSLSGPMKKTINDSYTARILTKSNPKVSEFLNRTFGQSAADTAGFLTVAPQGSESMTLGYTTKNVKSDPETAQEMLGLVNAERDSVGAKALVFDTKLAAVAEAHGRDMFARGYFSHNTPEGKTPFDRMDAAGINYLIAGENLALAPTLDEAFAGLMASPGHKANILSTDYGRVGIGVIDGGTYGKMFVQEFTN